jgi:hypothetical protein
MTRHASQSIAPPASTDRATVAQTREDRGTLLVFEDRRTDSPLVERVWRSRSGRSGRFASVAASHWEMVVTRVDGTTRMTVRGPETRATSAECPAAGEWIAIRFKLGTFMPTLPVGSLLDRQDIDLPQATKRSFWLDGAAWEYPSYENAETFVERLVRRGLIACDPLVDAVLHGRRHDLSLRSTQAHLTRSVKHLIGQTPGQILRREAQLSFLYKTDPS